jgi:vitamin B12 transporter
MNRHDILRVAAASALVTSPLYAQSAADSTTLDPVVVTASRSSEPASRASATVTVLHRLELQARGVTSVAEALRTVAGLSVVPTGPAGAATSVFMRGGNSNFVKVLVDGIPVNEAGGGMDWASLRLTNVDRIEIVRGPSSVLYGSDAVAGVVQIFTNAASRSRGTVQVRAGGYGTAEGRMEAAGGELVRWSVGASHLASDGLYEFNNGYRSNEASARIAGPLPAGFLGSATARMTDSRYRYPTVGSGQPTDSNAFTGDDLRLAGVQLSRSLAQRLDLAVRGSLRRLERTSSDAPDSPGDSLGFYSSSDATSDRQQLEILLTSRFSGGEATGGLERTWQHEVSDGRSRFASFPPATTHFDERRAINSAFAQFALSHGAAVRATLGGRLDDNERYGTFGTWRAHLSVMPLPALTLRASAGTAFREPSFSETFSTAFTNGNPALEPEQTRSAEVSVVARPNDWARLAVSAFDQRFENLIQYVSRSFGSTEPNYENLAAARARGVELEAEAAAGAWFTSASFTHLHTRVTNAGTGAGGTFVFGERLLRRPARSASLTAGYRAQHTIAVTASHTGERTDRDFSAFPARPVILAEYTRIDVAGSLALPAVGKSRPNVTIRVENVTDVDYQNVFGFRTPGRFLLAGLRLDW